MLIIYVLITMASGLSVFLKKIEDDECQASVPFVVMNSNYEKPEDHDSKATYLLMIPGFDEDPAIFSSIAKRLKIPAASIQLGPDCDANSIAQMAKYLWLNIRERVNLQSEFHILGYSFGLNIALELAALMEEEGNIGVIYSLDSSPDALRVQLETHIGRVTAKELQHIVISHIYHLISGRDDKELLEDLEKIDTWTGKVDVCIKRMKNSTTHSHQYMNGVIKNVYKKILLAREYEPGFKLESELVLLKADTYQNPDVAGLSTDYNLSKYTKQKGKIFHLKSDHLSAVEDVRVPNVINRFLEPELVEDFNRKNLCEEYIV